MVTVTVTTSTPYSGFNEAIKKWGLGTESSILQDLKWQKEVAGDAQKISQFKEVIGGLQDFRTYLFMKPGSAFVTVLHSIKALMDPYLEWYNGRIHLAEVLNAVGKRQMDLPTLPRFCYANG